MKKHLLTALTLGLLLTGCVTPGINPDAVYVPHSQGYEIVLKETQERLAHNSSLVNVPGREKDFVFESRIRTRAISGLIDAAQIEIIESSVVDGEPTTRIIRNATGSLRIEGDSLTLNILAPRPGGPDTTLRPYAFNGQYRLIRADAK